MLRGYCKKCGSMIYEVNDEASMPTSDVVICSDCNTPNVIRQAEGSAKTAEAGRDTLRGKRRSRG